MDIKTIPLNRLETNLQATLNECADAGQAFVVELPGSRFVAIQSLEPSEDDSLTSALLASDAAFQTLVAKSKASPRKPFVADDGIESSTG